jgi:aminopeptidase N
MMTRRAVFLVSVSSLMLLAVPGLAATQKPSDVSAPVTTQLPRTAKPLHYTIHVTPDAAKLRFTAQARIEIELLQPSKNITLNAADLAFKSVTLRNAAGTSVVAKVSLDAAAQTATFTLPTIMPVGKYTITADYSGKIYQQANGMFALDYKDPTGAEKRALFTQFEAPDARRFVPSWDEPNYKATFALSATVPAGQMAVSNMPLASQKPATKGLLDVTFQTSPKMSTYLLFFSVGEFDRITKKVGPTEVGVVVGRGNGEKGRYALEASARIVEYYNDYFDVPYPLPKLDNVAAPGQSQFFSAMENWGAIFTFERVLLVDPKITSARGKQNIFSTDAHEIAHQWFGNLVTMQWWDDLWLNEGFASWMESKATTHFNPEWQPELDRVSGRERAMALDAYATTHPVIQKIKTVEQTSQAFDTITYQKGEAVITMLEGFAGETVWRSGIRAYVKAHAYANTRTDDLWSAVEAAGAKGLTSIAHDFTRQPGVPLIKVVSAACAAGNTELVLEQGEFSRDRKARAEQTPLRWNVPVLAQTVGGSVVRTVVSAGKARMTVPGCAPLVLNAGQSGYYRVLYTPDMMMSLNKVFAQLPAVDQLGVLNDNLRLSYADYQPMTVSLDLLSAVPQTASQKVLEDAVDTYGSLHERFKSEPAFQARLAALVSKRFGSVLQKLGFAPVPGESLLDSNLRATLISTLGTMGDAAVLAEARRLFAALEANPAALDGPLRTSWLRVIAYNADQPTWNAIRKLGKSAETQVIKSTMYGLLGQTRDTALAQQALALALTDEPGSTTRAEIISSVADEHPDMAVDFALANLKAVERLVDVSSKSEYIGQLGSGSRDAAMPVKLDTYAKAHLTPDSRKTVDQSIASIRTRIATEPRIKAGIVEWLGHQS